MAHKKAGGSTRLGRDSESKRLGVKVFGGQIVKAGAIIVRQKGTRFGAGTGTRLGRDHTLYSITDGRLTYSRRSKRSFTGARRNQVVANVATEK